MNDSVLSGRLRISDELWKAIEPLVKEFKKRQYCPPKLSDRMFVEAILYQARTGNPWRDLPKEFGCWICAYKRFRRWENAGLWKQIWKHLQSLDAKPVRNLFIDSTVVRAHQHASSVSKKGGGQQKQAMGRSCGGLTTKLHAACSDDRTAVSFSLGPGQSHDATAFPAVWKEVPKSRWLNAAVMDKASDCDDIRKFLEYQGIEAVIPPKANRKKLLSYDKVKYRMRQKVERFFCRIKEFRRIATRYDKLAKTFMAFVHLVCAFVAFQPNQPKNPMPITL